MFCWTQRDTSISLTLYALALALAFLVTNAHQNVASEFRPDKKLHSKSGTLAYLAPEVYGGGGYLDEVDWWSLGVTFYEAIYNKASPSKGMSHRIC